MKLSKSNRLFKTTVASLMVAGVLGASTPAFASHIPGTSFFGNDFVFDGTAYGAGTAVTADDIDFSYFAEVDQFGTGPVFNFTETGIVTFSTFNYQFGTVNANDSGLNTAFKMYAEFSAAGTSDFSGGVGAEGTFSSFAIDFFIDPSSDTTFLPGFPGVTNGGVNESYSSNPANNGDDINILSGTLNIGGFHVFGGLANGDFDVLFDVTSFDTSVWSGDAFADPNAPIVGDLSGVNTDISGVSGSTFIDATIVGAGLAQFQVNVPAPSTVAILGLGMFGLAFAARRKSDK